MQQYSFRCNANDSDRKNSFQREEAGFLRNTQEEKGDELATI
jgi:hypothetical protein